MLPLKNRLNRKKDFELIFKKGKSFFCDFLGIKVYFKEAGSDTRCGIIVSNKISKKAHIRNKIKRRIRNALYGIIKENKLSGDLVVLTLPLIKEAGFGEIKKELEKLIKKASQTYSKNNHFANKNISKNLIP